MTVLRAFSLSIAILAGSSPILAAPPEDPLRSTMWREVAARYFPGGEIVFDGRVKVAVPGLVENQAQVPVTVDARALSDVTEIVVVADLNPIQHVLTLRPRAAAPYASFRVKLEQGTPVRAAARTSDGVWHVGGVFLDAMGGGCSSPALARKDADWSETVGQTQGRLWREADGLARLRLRMRHPMDTGLAKDNTPAFFVERLTVSTGSGVALAEIEAFEPLSEDPTLTLLVRLPAAEPAVTIEARDNNGGTYRGLVPAPWHQSALDARGK